MVPLFLPIFAQSLPITPTIPFIFASIVYLSNEPKDLSLFVYLFVVFVFLHSNKLEYNLGKLLYNEHAVIFLCSFTPTEILHLPGYNLPLYKQVKMVEAKALLIEAQPFA